MLRVCSPGPCTSPRIAEHRDVDSERLGVIKYIVFNPLKVGFSVFAGMVLGLAGFYAYQVGIAVTAVATEDFDPVAARDDIDADPLEGREIVFVEPTDDTGESLDLLALQEELAAAFDITKPFDPYEFIPFSFVEPIPD